MPDTLLSIAADDIDSMYDATYGFAETLTGPSGDFLAVWDNAHVSVAVDGMVPVESREPQFRCRDADALDQGDTVTRDSVDYTVISVQPDGLGEVIHLVHLA